MTLLVGNIANAGVMLSMSSNEMRASRTLTLVELADLRSSTDQDRQDEYWDSDPGSNMGIVSLSSPSSSLTAILAVSRTADSNPRQITLVKLINRSLPPAPYMDGLLKPPELTCSS
jgi:hypothetical protein